jgi:hypothetical protein
MPMADTAAPLLPERAREPIRIGRQSGRRLQHDEAQIVEFSFTAPMRARTEVDMRRAVRAIEYKQRLEGWVGQLDGSAFSGGTDCVIARAPVRVKQI